MRAIAVSSPTGAEPRRGPQLAARSPQLVACASWCGRFKADGTAPHRAVRWWRNSRGSRDSRDSRDVGMSDARSHGVGGAAVWSLFGVWCCAGQSAPVFLLPFRLWPSEPQSAESCPAEEGGKTTAAGWPSVSVWGCYDRQHNAHLCWSLLALRQCPSWAGASSTAEERSRCRHPGVV